MCLAELLGNFQALRTMRQTSAAGRALASVKRQLCIESAGPLQFVVVPGIPLIAENLGNREAFLAARHAVVAQPADLSVRILAHHFDSPGILCAQGLA